MFFPQALLAGFSFRTGEHKAFAVRKIAATPDKVPILHKNLLGNLPGNVPSNLFGTFFGNKKPCKSQVPFLTWDPQGFFPDFRDVVNSPQPEFTYTNVLGPPPNPIYQPSI